MLFLGLSVMVYCVKIVIKALESQSVMYFNLLVYLIGSLRVYLNLSHSKLKIEITKSAYTVI